MMYAVHSIGSCVMHCNVGNRLVLYSRQISTNAALRWYKIETERMGHWDIDEYSALRMPPKQFYDPANKTCSMANLTTKKKDSQHNDLSGGAVVDPIMTPYWHVQCKGCFLLEKQNTKGLYKTSMVKLFGVHMLV
ncbi:hypothetical protein ACA910_020844 [Epithemia clementina (nom. ined.)]